MHIRKLAQTAGSLFLSILLTDTVSFVFWAKISFETHCVCTNYARRFFAFLEVGYFFSKTNNNNNNNNNVFSQFYFEPHFCLFLLLPVN